jgi:type II secretory pathway predicted ATPase ExeA
MDSKTPFATVLAGQPTLRRMIKLGVLAASERPADRRPLPDDRHDPRRDRQLHPPPPATRRRDDDLFSDAAQIHQAARGKPRTVSNLAIATLIAT